MAVQLVLFKANGERKAFPLKIGVTRIGRGKDNDLRVPLDSVSRKHCEVTVSGNIVGLRDVGSANGTMVNGEAVTTGTLKPGDELKVGNAVFMVQIDGRPPIQQAQSNYAAHAQHQGHDPYGAGDADPISALQALHSPRPAADDPFA